MGRARGPGGGRRPKPTALKVLAGNAGHRPLNKGEPRPRPLLPKCPPVLQGEAKAEWRRMGKKLHALGLLSEIDGAALTTYCLTWARLVDAEGNHLIWQEDARSGAPATLLGRPVLKNYRSPALGTLGDVLLANFSYYVVKDGVGLTVAASEHVLFKQNKTVVKAFKAVDGAPWLDAPIAQEDTQTYSPFVALDVP